MQYTIRSSLHLTSMSNPDWTPIAGYEGIYEVSRLGEIRSLTRKDALGRTKQGQLMKQTPNEDGYLQIVLSRDSGQRTFKVHRIVGQTFIPNPEDKPEVNHIDEVKTNNTVDNLEWNTRKENVNHSIHQIEKQYLFVSPEGVLTHVQGMRSFCREHGLSATSMTKVDNLEKDDCNGWTSPFKEPKPPKKLAAAGNPWISGWKKQTERTWSSVPKW